MIVRKLCGGFHPANIWRCFLSIVNYLVSCHRSITEQQAELQENPMNTVNLALRPRRWGEISKQQKIQDPHSFECVL
jgi:hypothetical protein